MTRSVFTDSYGALLRVLVAARTNAGVTQKELASRLSRPQPFVSYVERGERRLDVIEFIIWVRALGLSPHEMFARVEAEVDPNDRI